ncbi:MAG: hypothetical protein A2X03_10805 [Bacteroidetes bacterium GWA2_40_15]|nr:MAG: hypothetical protein A2X03_10805 [Bacteroidetes bacterium GWA2_40_15]
MSEGNNNHSSVNLGSKNTYVLSDNPTGGTAFAALESFCVPGLLENNPLLIITMGDRIIPSSVFRRLVKKHTDGTHEADLTFLSAIYEPPKNRGKGRVLRDDRGKVERIIEEKDIVAEEDDLRRQSLLSIKEGNCPLYAIRAKTLHSHLSSLSNDNAQKQYYLTNIIQSISCEDEDVRTITTSVNEPEYDLLVSDVTQPMDLAMLEGILSTKTGLQITEEIEERRRKNQPLPPSSLWVTSNMRRPFALVGNAIASMRTLRTGNMETRVREYLGIDNFRRLKLVSSGNIPEEKGVPLRAMVAYLFGEVAKNFYLIHNQDEWIEYVSRSQRGDCCLLEGSGFFRCLALIDLAEAMLRRAFGINPDPDFVEIHTGGGATGVKLNRFDQLPLLLDNLRRLSANLFSPDFPN